MRVLLSTDGSRGDVEPMVAPAVRLRALGAEVRVCAPPDEEFAEQPALIDDGPTPTTESLPAALMPAPAAGTRARARAVAAPIRTDGATVAAELLLDAVSRDRPPVAA